MVPRACPRLAGATCEVGDGGGPIDRETVPAGVVQDCVAFNQHVGAGLDQVPGFRTGECFGRARVWIGDEAAPRVRPAPHRCLPGGGRSRDAGPPPPVVERPGREPATLGRRGP